MSLCVITDDGSNESPVLAEYGDVGWIIDIIDEDVFDVDWPGGCSVTARAEFTADIAAA